MVRDGGRGGETTGGRTSSSMVVRGEDSNRFVESAKFWAAVRAELAHELEGCLSSMQGVYAAHCGGINNGEN